MTPPPSERVVLEQWVAVLWAKACPRRRGELVDAIRQGAGPTPAAVAQEALAIVETLMRTEGQSH